MVSPRDLVWGRTANYRSSLRSHWGPGDLRFAPLHLRTCSDLWRPCCKRSGILQIGLWPLPGGAPRGFSISPSSTCPGLVSFRIDCTELLAVPRGSPESSPAPPHKSISSSLVIFAYFPSPFSASNISLMENTVDLEPAPHLAPPLSVNSLRFSGIGLWRTRPCPAVRPATQRAQCL